MRLDRLKEMEQYIINKETVELEDLADYFHVSVNTVRRDINELVTYGKIKKVYGGVSVCESNQVLPMDVRAAKNRELKKNIGAIASTLISDGDTIFMDSGSTVLNMLPHLARKKDITIITHSLSAMYEASKFPSLQVIALGGLYNHTTSSYVGLSTLEALAGISPNAIIIAATGVSLENGLTNTTYFEAEIKKKVVRCCQKVILLADSSKFDTSSTISFFHFKDLYAVVTDSKPSKKYIDYMNQHHIILLYGEDNQD